MGAKLIGVNHLGLVVRNFDRAIQFYVDILGFRRHESIESWLCYGPNLTVHLIEIPEAEVDDENLFHMVNHVAFQVDDLSEIQRTLLHHDRHPFQMDFDGNEHSVDNIDDDLSFGIGTLFVQDDDSNLIEFVEMGIGIYASDPA